MSHFTTIETQIQDIGALSDACEEMGLELVGNTIARGYGDNNIKADYVIRLKGPYDIALNHEQNGRFSLTTDWWHGHVKAEVGENFSRLRQLYAVHKTCREAGKRGFTARRVNLRDGRVKVTIGGRL